MPDDPPREVRERRDVLDALDRVVREQRAALAGLARAEGLGAEDAFDCVHDALCSFLELAVRKDLPAEATEHAPLLAAIVRNAARNKRRRHHLARPHEILDEDAFPADAPDAEALLAQAEACVRLRSCVERLCGSQRTVVMMRLLQERNAEDVAKELGIARGYVDVLLNRARRAPQVCARSVKRLSRWPQYIRSRLEQSFRSFGSCSSLLKCGTC